MNVWMELTYRNGIGRIVGHTFSGPSIESAFELMERYNLSRDDILTFQVNGKDHILPEGLPHAKDRTP